MAEWIKGQSASIFGSVVPLYIRRIAVRDFMYDHGEDKYDDGKNKVEGHF